MANKNITVISILLLMMTATAVCETKPKVKVPKSTLPEGYVLNYVQGEFSVSATGKSYFKIEDEIKDSGLIAEAGKTFKMLPSSTLEKLETLVKMDDCNKTIRLQATVVKYEGISYLFAASYIPLAAQESIEEPEPEATAEEGTETTEKPKKDSILSDEVKELLTPKFTPNLKQNKLPETFKVKDDYNLVSRTGFLTIDKDGKNFRIDSLGRKRAKSGFIPLPCGTLEMAEKKTYRIPGRRRYKISGIVTRYKGQDYLLLQKIVETYNHGNFAR